MNTIIATVTPNQIEAVVNPRTINVQMLAKGPKGEAGIVRLCQTITIEQPQNEDRTIFVTDVPIAIEKVYSSVSNDSIQFDIKHSTDRNTATPQSIFGEFVSAAGQEFRSITGGTIPANSYIWLVTQYPINPISELHLTIYFTNSP